MPTLSTDRLNIRWLIYSDLDALFDIFSHPDVCRFWSSPPMIDRQQAVDLLEHIHDSFRQHRLYEWGLALRASDEVVGTCTLAQLDFQNRRAEIGFALGRKYWRQGYISESLPILLDFAFGTLNLHRMEADVDPRNDKSIRVLKGCGFEKEGYLRERWIVDGQVADTVLWGLLRRDWERRNRVQQ